MFTLIKETLSSPLNWLLIGIILYLARSIAANRRSANVKPIGLPAREEPEQLRNFKPTELKKFNGTDDPKIFMAVLGRVYDVTPGAAFYGPQGPYSNFAGRDASRGLAKNSFNEDMLVDTDGPIDTLEDLANDEKMTLMEWASHFQFKYIHIGYLVENDYDGPQYVAPEKKEEKTASPKRD